MINAWRWTEERIEILLACNTDEELQGAFPTHNLSTLKRAQRNYKKEGTPQDSEAVQLLPKLREALERAGVPEEAVGSIRSIRAGTHEMGSKDAEGNPQVTQLSNVQFVIDPTFKDGPKWPVIQPAPPVSIHPVKVKPNKSKYKTAVILPDPQIGYWRDIDTGELDPFHDERAMSVALQVARDLNPDMIVNLGDFMDFPEWGKFEQTPTFQMTTQATIDRGHKFLAEQKTNAPNAHIVLLSGNHEARLQRSIINNAKAAFGLKRANNIEGWPVLSVQNLLRIDDLGVEYVDGYPAAEYWINDRIKCIHGHIVRSNGSTAKAVSDDERVSTIFGHIHRVEMQYKTVGVRAGIRTNLAFSPGCLCRIDGAVPSTKSAVDAMGRPVKTHENWQQGFGVVSYIEGDGEFSVEPVYINEGTAIFRGKKYSA